MLSRAALVATAGAWALAAPAHAAQAPQDLSGLSLEELGEVQVTSVSKHAEPIGEAPSSVFVISHDDIAASGARSLPEILRLAPNLEVQQVTASQYVITARGLNGAPAAQNFANKLLVLIDGRTVYSPLFSGVYWDMQGVLPDDIERIEVISGPGATLWGANAVNGVINIITRSSGETQGGLIDAVAGNHGVEAALRVGGRAGRNLAWRAYAQSFFADNLKTQAGQSANDHWSRPQAGFRIDWTPTTSDAFTLQGDGYSGFEAQADAPANNIKGGNLTGRWTRSGQDGSTLQVQAYYDRAERGVEGAEFWVDTYDVDLQRSGSLGARQDLVWGGGYRVSRYEILGAGALQWAPDSRTLQIANAFVQDAIRVTPELKVVLGAKLAADPYQSPTVLPSVRVAWTPDAGVMLWGGISRAIRSPTPFDRDVVEFSGPTKALVGGGLFESEKLVAYELGAKLYASTRASLEVTAFYHHYDDLRTVELTPVTLLPLFWGNQMEGRVYGLEAWGLYQLKPWWRVSAGFTHLQEEFWFKPGAPVEILGLNQAADDPRYQAQVRSTWTRAPLSVDAALRYVSALRDPRVGGYAELNAQIAWDVTERLRLAINGRNLLHKQHLEYVGGEEIPRTVFAALQWRF